jgi:hypothetical protein
MSSKNSEAGAEIGIHREATDDKLAGASSISQTWLQKASRAELDGCARHPRPKLAVSSVIAL